MIDEVLALAFFCEDIREEAAGTVTLVGVVTDNINVPRIPGIVGKLGIYTRVLLPIAVEPQAMEVVLRLPNDAELPLGTFSTELMLQALEEAKSNGNPLAGLIAQSIASPFPIVAEGLHQVFLKAAGREKLVGMIHVKSTQPAGEEPNPSQSTSSETAQSGEPQRSS